MSSHVHELMDTFLYVRLCKHLFVFTKPDIYKRVH